MTTMPGTNYAAPVVVSVFFSKRLHASVIERTREWQAPSSSCMLWWIARQKDQTILITRPVRVHA
jgi:hypothetical protein